MLPTLLRMTFGQGPPPARTANEWVQNNVKELMGLWRLTQAELAERLGVSQPWLSKRLTGKTPFQIEDLDALAHAFGLSPHELLCAGFGQWDRRDGRERRSGADRRRGVRTPLALPAHIEPDEADDENGDPPRPPRRQSW